MKILAVIHYVLTEVLYLSAIAVKRRQVGW